MNYPLISDYISSILSAEDNFKELTNLRPVLDEEGQPIMSSGNFAVVFKMKDEQTGKLYAIKCFLKEQEGRDESYRMIEEELEFVSSNYLTPIRYMENELFVDSSNTNETEFPVLLMDWIEGVTLDKYIRSHIGYAYGLAMITYRFSKLASWLLAQPFAHGDLKSDNILVKENGSLILVDYDGMFVPAMKGQKAREIGSPDFRHPKRTENDFDEHIDDFSIASILLSLKAISLDSKLLEIYGASDRLLFSQKDYLDLSISYIIDALRPLMVDNELNMLFSLFLLAHSKSELSSISLQLLDIKRPIKEIEKIELTNDKLNLSIPDVQKEMGIRFFYGFGVPKDEEEAFRWFSISAEQGVAKAQYNLGLCYYRGYGVSQDYFKAVKWLKKAAEQGNDKAQVGLGLCYYRGNGVSQDYFEAVKWIRKAAVQGNTAAQNDLGVCYKRGYGVTQDYSKAVKWYRKAAEQGDIIAQNNLGVCYKRGDGVAQNHSEAVKWFRRSAEQGDANAQYNLGLCYESGNGVIQNLHIANEWFVKASNLGHKEALNKIRK